MAQEDNNTEDKEIFRGSRGHCHTCHDDGSIDEQWEVNEKGEFHGYWRKFDRRHCLMEKRLYDCGRLVWHTDVECARVTVDRDHSGMQRWLEDIGGNVWHIPFETAYDLRVDLAQRIYLSVGGEDLPTVQELLEEGSFTEMFCYDEVSMTYNFDGDEGIRLGTVQDFFRQHGYNVSIDAIFWCYRAWSMDCESGYRDEKNGYHLFTPCGHNRLRFTLTSLHPLCEEWQTTYAG